VTAELDADGSVQLDQILDRQVANTNNTLSR
jgi:hypothetical protein